MTLPITKKLVLIFFVALLSLLLIEFVFTKQKERKEYTQMTAAVTLTKYWFSCVEQMKNERGIFSDAKSPARYKVLIGDEFTYITTTLGSLEAKEISTNPEFSALIVRYLTDCEIDSTKTVGIILSGSFPALGISCLAAIQKLKVNAIIFSSLGASMYGANQIGATWLDIENYLKKKCGLKYQSNLVSLGTENDNGGGLSEEGIQQLKLIVSGYGIDLYRPNSLEESIETKLDILLSRKVDLLINIGGNQTSFGTCIHSSSIPNGLHRNLKTCLDENRGIIARLSEKGIPFVNLLNIKNLAVENNISINPSITSSKLLYTERNTNKIPLVISIVILSAFLILIRERKYSC